MRVSECACVRACVRAGVRASASERWTQCRARVQRCVACRGQDSRDNRGASARVRVSTQSYLHLIKVRSVRSSGFQVSRQPGIAQAQRPRVSPNGTRAEPVSDEVTSTQSDRPAGLDLGIAGSSPRDTRRRTQGDPGCSQDSRRTRVSLACALHLAGPWTSGT